MCNQLQERFVFYIFNTERGLGMIIFLHLLNYPGTARAIHSSSREKTGWNHLTESRCPRSRGKSQDTVQKGQA